jgi:hypothetical protein
MGTELSKQLISSASVSSEKVTVTRYSVDVTVRYRGTFKEYVYVSEEYRVQIQPGDAANPIVAYDPARWKGVSNEQTQVQMKKSTLELCREFLKAREHVTNLLQIELPVSH